ncbi:hypothetical protein [Streptomyces wuyuanensis]|uniref:hypothetical protein n=1 Tax=Streptomyces wuyuanensis TaxID=1196353 RepID=UPI003715A237
MPKAGFTYGKRIPGPDYAAITKAAQDEVMESLAYIALPEDRVARAADIVRQADAEIALHVDERDQAVAHLWFYEQRLGLHRTIGVTPNAYREILSKAMFGDAKKPTPDAESQAELVKLAKQARIPRVEDAAEKVLKMAEVVAKARARREKAVRFMQDAVLALSQPPYDWSPEKIAEHAGVSRSLIYKQRTAARKRRDG